MISHVMTLANSIIGVSVLAMPFCFKQCGIILATLMLLLSSTLSRLACHFLIKSAVMSRRRNFEFLAFHAFGSMGKVMAELCIIGFLLGTCIAFFVVVGDLGPQIIGELVNKDPSDIRTSFLITTGIFIVLPLGLLRNIDSLASVSTASIAFYICLVLKVIGESTHHIFTADAFNKVNYWQPGGILQCLPIFALALFCQTQLFEIYETMPNATLEKMNEVVRGSLNICTVVYLCVGFFGYIAFCNQSFTGNILMSFEPSLTSEIIKIGFVLSVAFSFPLVIFPCRASLNSLLFRRGYAYETSMSYISEVRFRCLTTFIVTIALIVGILIPNIEFVLGIVGSTIGVLICLIFPAAFFVSISTKNTNERTLAQIIIIIGVSIMVLGTYANLYAMEQSSNHRSTTTTVKIPSQLNNMPEALMNNEILGKPEQEKHLDNLQNTKDNSGKTKPKVPDKFSDNENIRREPPVPVERLSEFEKLKNKDEINILDTVTMNPKIQEIVDKINNMDNELIKETNIVYNPLNKKKETNELPLKPNANLVSGKESENANPNQNSDIIAVDAIKKEESELAADKEISNNEPLERREQLEKTLKKHIMEQKEMMLEQKELLKDIEQKNKELLLAEKKGESKTVLDKSMSNNESIQKVEQNKEIFKEHISNEKEIKQENKKLLLEGKEAKLDLVLDTKISNVKTMQMQENLKEHIAEQKEMMLEQKQFREDIEQKNKKLSLTQEKDKEEQENNNNDMKVNKLPNKSKETDIKIETKVDLEIQEKHLKPAIPENKETSVNKHNANNDRIPMDAKKQQIENMQLSNSGSPKGIKNFSLDSNTNQVPENIPIKKSENPIIKALTKQSNKLSNDNEDANIPKDDKDTNTILNDNINKKNEKDKKFSIPIVLKMNNQSKQIMDPERLKINQSNSDVMVVRRDILEEHPREKRMIEVKNNTASNNIYNKTINIEDHKYDLETDDKRIVKTEKLCTKKIPNLQSTNMNEKNDFEDIDGNSENIIKTSVHLSNQDVLKKVTIDTNLNGGDNFIKLKKRDLKSWRFYDVDKK